MKKVLKSYEILEDYYSVSNKDKDFFKIYREHRKEQFLDEYKSKAALDVFYVKKKFYMEIETLRYSGLQVNDIHYKVLQNCLLLKYVVTSNRKRLRLLFSKDVLKSAYLISEALGMKECMEKLEFIKNYKRKNEIE